jgi:hypothetical protein
VYFFERILSREPMKRLQQHLAIYPEFVCMQDADADVDERIARSL